MTAPGSPGTIVEISDLFFNTPARLKFLKAASTELAATLRIVSQLALAHPGVRVRVSHDGRGALTAPAATDLRERIGALWSWPVAERLLAVGHTEHGVRVSGWASPPDLTRGGRDDIVVIVNGRPVRDPALAQAVLTAYRPLLPRDRFPLVVRALALAPAVFIAPIVSRHWVAVLDEGTSSSTPWQVAQTCSTSCLPGASGSVSTCA